MRRPRQDHPAWVAVLLSARARHGVRQGEQHAFAGTRHCRSASGTASKVGANGQWASRTAATMDSRAPAPRRASSRVECTARGACHLRRCSDRSRKG